MEIILLPLLLFGVIFWIVFAYGLVNVFRGKPTNTSARCKRGRHATGGLGSCTGWYAMRRCTCECHGAEWSNRL